MTICVCSLVLPRLTPCAVIGIFASVREADLWKRQCTPRLLRLGLIPVSMFPSKTRQRFLGNIQLQGNLRE